MGMDTWLSPEQRAKIAKDLGEAMTFPSNPGGGPDEYPNSREGASPALDPLKALVDALEYAHKSERYYPTEDHWSHWTEQQRQARVALDAALSGLRTEVARLRALLVPPNQGGSVPSAPQTQKETP